MKVLSKKNISSLLLVLYLFVGFLPSFGAVDKIGSQFVYLNIINLFSLIFLIKTRSINSFISDSKEQIKSGLLLWILYGIWGICSSLYAVNTSEVWIESSRVFVYVIALLNVFLLLKSTDINLIFIARLFAITLIIESLWVFNTFIELSLEKTLLNRNLELRSFTGNINLTAFTMVLKTPFLIFSLYKNKNLNILFKLIVLFLVLSVIYLLGSRGANLTLIIIFFSLAIISLINDSFLNRRFLFGLLLTFMISIGLNAVFFSNAKGINYLQRTTTLNDQSSNERIRFYSNAIESIKENPIKGIGLGNWKLASIKFDGPDMDSYRVPYHVHNDFLEITAELGLIGFVLFYGLYIILLIGYYKFFTSNVKVETKLLGIVITLGLMVYLADSFLNFPFTRPVMQIPNILLIACSFYLFSKQNINILSISFLKFYRLKAPIYLVIFSGIIFSFWISIKVYKSFVEQRFLIVTVAGDYTDYSLDKVEAISSDLPNITALTTPIDALKAALFLRKDSIEVLPLIEKGIKANPYMGYGELLKSAYFIENDKIDSALYYSKKAYKILPKQINHFDHYLNLIQVTGDTTALKEVYRDLDETNTPIKYEKYLQVAGKIKQNIGLSEREIVNMLTLKNPKSSFNKVFNVLGEIGRENISNGVFYSNLAEKEFSNKNYDKAADLFKIAANYNPLEKAYYENAANALTKVNKNSEAISILEKMIVDLDPDNGKAEYLLGIIYLDEKQNEKGCSYLKISKNKGFEFPEQILTRFCK